MYKVFEKRDEYGPFFEIYPFPTLIQLAECFGGIQHCITVIGKCIFENNIMFALPLTHDYLEYLYNDENETKGMNGYKLLLKAISFFNVKNTCFVQM